MALEDDIQQLSARIEQMKVDYTRFFRGVVPTPPDSLRRTIVKQLRDLRGRSASDLVDQFRLGTLEARFNSLSELFSRQLREHEEGATATPTVTAKAAFNPTDGVLDTDPEAAAGFAKLHTALYAGDETNVDVPMFERYLRQKAEAIRGRTGCQAVRFRVIDDDGTPRLRARAVD